jgi:hypothetical protein
MAWKPPKRVQIKICLSSGKDIIGELYEWDSGGEWVSVLDGLYPVTIYFDNIEKIEDLTNRKTLFSK